MGSVARSAGIDKVITLASDDDPGIDAEKAFTEAFEKEGGTIVGSIRVPSASDNFSPLLQQVRNSGAEALFAFQPVGPAARALVRAYDVSGLKAAGIRFFRDRRSGAGDGFSGCWRAGSGLDDHLSLRGFALVGGERRFPGGRTEGDRQSRRASFPAVGSGEERWSLYQQGTERLRKAGRAGSCLHQQVI